MTQTIIMIHGFRGTHHGLTKIADSLPNSYNLLIPDIPGFGEGELLEGYSLDDYTAWLHRFIKAQKLTEPPVLLGHSFGSIITATYTSQHPEMIEKLILVNPIGTPALEGPRAILTKLAVAYYWISRKLPKPIAKHWLSAKLMVFIMSTTMAKTTDKTLRKWIHQEHYTHFSSFQSVASVSDAFITSISHNVRDVATSVQLPTLLIVGDRDDITPLHDQEKLHNLMPTSTLHVIKNVGHLTHYETPDEVAAAVQDFIKPV